MSEPAGGAGHDTGAPLASPWSALDAAAPAVSRAPTGPSAASSAMSAGRPERTVCVVMSISLTTPLIQLVPLRDEDVRVPLARRTAVGCEDQVLAVGAEHREAVEHGARRHALEVLPVDVDQVEIEVAPRRIAEIGAEDDPAAGGVPVRREVRCAVVGDAALVRPVRVHHVDVQLARPDQPLLEQ